MAGLLPLVKSRAECSSQMASRVALLCRLNRRKSFCDKMMQKGNDFSFDCKIMHTRPCVLRFPICFQCLEVFPFGSASAYYVSSRFDESQRRALRLINKLVRVTLAVALLSLATTVFASTAQVVNGGFETGDFSGWTQFGDTTFNGVCSATLGGGNCPDGNFMQYAGDYAAYFGPVGDTGGIYQDITTVPGQMYTISFYLALPDGGTPNFFSVQFGTGSISFNDFPGTFGWGLFQFTDVATSTTTRLTFTFREDPDYWFLDNVNVTNGGGGTTPEPGTLVLFGSGLLGIAGVARRKFRS